MAPVRVINNKDEFESALAEAGDKLVVVDFHALWCGPCKRIAPAVEFHGHLVSGDFRKLTLKQKLAEDNEDVVFLKVDVDDLEELAAEKEVSAMPTFQFYKSKNQVDIFKGANLDKLKEYIAKYK